MQTTLFSPRLVAGALAVFLSSGAAATAAVLLSDPFANSEGPLSKVPGWYEGLPNMGAPTDSGRHFMVKDDALFWDGFASDVNSIFCHRFVRPKAVVPPVLFVGFALKVETLPARVAPSTRGVIGNTFLAFTSESGRAQRGQLGIVFGEMGGSYRLSLGQSSSVTREDVLPLELMAAEEVRVVIAYDTVGHVATIWVNPSGRADEPPLRSTGAGVAVRMDSIGIRMHNRGAGDLGSLRISRLVVATTFVEAMPAK